MTLGKKLFLLTGFNVALSIALATGGIWGIWKLNQATESVLRYSMVLQSHQNGDMAHDAIRGDVLQAQLIAFTKDPRYGTLEEAKSALDEHATIFTDAVSANINSGLPNQEVIALSQTALPLVENYVAQAHRVFKSLAGGDAAQVSAMSEEFVVSFEKLETAMGAISEKLEAAALAVREEERSFASNLPLILGSLTAFAVLAGIIFSGFLVRSVVGTIRAHLDRLARCSQRLRGSSEVMGETSQELAAGASQQASAIQETVAAITEILSMLASSKESTKASLSTADQVNAQTKRGAQIMTRLAEAMNGIQETNQSLQKMGDIIQQVSEKTGVINDIVFKTQLLSFNASIEAARAGQHGRGFSVVAEEVGNLAELSGCSAREIESLLEDSRRQVREIVELVQHRVSEGQTVTNEALDIFNRITDQADRLSSFITQIHESGSEQETGAQQVSLAMKEMSDAASRTTNSAAETSSEAQDIRRQSDILTHVVQGLTKMLYARSPLSSSLDDTPDDESHGRDGQPPIATFTNQVQFPN